MLKTLAAATMVLALPALAQEVPENPCNSYHVVKGALLEKYGEVPIGRGPTLDGKMVLEIYLNLETGTWSAVGTRPTRLGPNVTMVSCILSVGKNWEILVPEVGEEG